MFTFNIPHLLLAALALGTFAHAQVSPVTMTVDQTSKSDTDKHKKTVTRALKFRLTNNSAEPLEVRVKYGVFGRSIATHEIVLVSGGEKPASLKPRVMELVEVPIAIATTIDEHFEKKAKVAASGTKLVGYGAQVFIGEKMVLETYDPLSLKENWGKAAPAPK